MKRRIPIKFMALGLPLILTGCFSSGGGSVGSSGESAPSVVAPGPETNNPPQLPGEEVPDESVSGFGLPEQLEVIPVESQAEAYSLKSSDAAQMVSGILSGALLAADQGATSNALQSVVNKAVVEDTRSDYEKESTQIHVNVESLDQFDIVNFILKALKQARYDDPKVLGKGPYAALIHWEEDQSSTLEKWILDSRMTQVDGRFIHVVDLWVEDEEELVKAKMQIFAPATNENPYGEWELHAQMFDLESNPRGNFTASTKLNAQGEAEITFRMEDMGHGDGAMGMGKLILTDSDGKGMLRYPDHSRSEDGEEVVTIKTAKYAYNQAQVIIENEEDVSCRSRNDYYDVMVDYGVYNSAGSRLDKMNRYGFTVAATSPEGKKKYYWYGAYQGRHGLYGYRNGVDLEEGTIVTAQDRDGRILQGDDFIFDGCHRGHLSRRVEANTSLEELKGGVFNTWVSEQIHLKLDDQGEGWLLCQDNSELCLIPVDENFQLTDYVPNPEQKRETRIYLFQGENFRMVEMFIGSDQLYFSDDGQQVTLVAGDELYLYHGGPLFLTYQDGQWLEFEYYYDPNRENDWEATLGESHPYQFKKSDFRHSFYGGRFEYVVEIGDATLNQVTSVKRIMDMAVTPLDSGLLNGQELFQLDYSGELVDGQYAYNPLSLALENDLGEKVEQGMDRLYSPNLDEYFRWNYSMEDEDWAKVCYLKNLDGDYEILDAATYFRPTEIEGKTIGVFGYDGHLFGIPHYYQILKENGGELPEDEKENLLNIPTGEYRSLSSDESYLIRPLHGFRVLERVDSEDCGVELDQSVDLEGIPEFQSPNLGATPQLEDVLVIEGEFLE